jgi:tetratricopeptide (TPR) repeat protein
MKPFHLFRTLAGAMLALALFSSPLMARQHKSDSDKKEALYPNATREAPKLDLTSPKDQKAINEGLDAVGVGDNATAEQLLGPIAEGGSKSKYAQALALQGLANLKYNDGDVKGAIASLQKSLDIGVMPNDTYFQLLYELAQFQLADEQYQAALDTIAKWRAEGKKETADSYALEGNAYYRLEKYPEAIAAIQKAKSLTDKPKDTWNQILMASYAQSGQKDQAMKLAQEQLAANPNDPEARNNAVSVLVNAEKYPEAIQLLEKARAAGTLTEEKDNMTLAKLYLLQAQSSNDPAPNAAKAAQVLQDGIDKHTIAGNGETYKLMGQAYEMAGNSAKAIAAYNLALPQATDGESALRAAHLLMVDNKFSQAKPLLEQAIQKGVKHKGTAYMLLAETERALKNKPAAIAAMKQAAQQPETAEKAKAWLKSAGVSK